MAQNSKSLFCLIWLATLCSNPSATRAAEAASGLSAAQVFAVADKAIEAGDTKTAEAAYNALMRDADPEIRIEAMFRNGRLLEAQRRFVEAAVLYRAILDEKPDAQPVRLELAKVLALMGDGAGARRALRQAQAGGLPPDIARIVDQYAAALRSFKPYGGSFELALAPSSNINRATSATTLDTIIAPFELSRDAREKSGLGLRVGGQGYLKLPLTAGLQLTTRVSAQSNLYKAKQFDDAIASAQAGLEAVAGKSRFRALGGRSYRWYGGRPYATTDSLSLNWTRGIGKRAQIEAEAGIGWADYRLNDLQDGRIYDASLSYERAFSGRSGGSLTLSGQRQSARDKGYATTSAGLSALIWFEAGKATLFGTASLNRLEADARLLLFPERRAEWLARLGLGATLRHIKVSGFSPVLRLNYERNRSTVGLYDYRRFGGEFGVTRAF